MTQAPTRLVLSFDIEEHDRIEAAAGLTVGAALRESYRGRLIHATLWLLDQLAARALPATFFVVGAVAEHSPDLVRRIAEAGHELASHSHEHRSLLRLTPDEFRADLRRSRIALEQAGRVPVVGFRAPTFSIVRRAAWAIDILAEEGFLYDSSIYPVRHDRYGIPEAPRRPFLVVGARHGLIELPPATLRLAGVNLPIGGGGYFRLLPGSWFRHATARALRDDRLGICMLYFHPWEFDPDQPRLPLSRLGRWRTYTGIPSARRRFCRLLDMIAGRAVIRADALARQLTVANLVTMDVARVAPSQREPR
jgi:polysaccharide deacetylase family protein (PEP-CTERM system associated)